MATLYQFNMIGRSLKNCWASLGVEINRGVSTEELTVFESKYSVRLPADLRDYFLTVDGMAEDVTDDSLIRFWPLNEVKPVTEEAPAFSDSSYILEAESLFVFADFCIWSHAYAIRLSSDNESPNPVFVIGGEQPEKMFDSFSDLVASYLIDPDRLFTNLNETATRRL